MRSADTGGHGSHVAGTSARDGSGSESVLLEPAGTYKGAAPNADLIIVKSYDPETIDKNFLIDNLFNLVSLNTKLVDAIDYIFKKVDALAKPAVINISMGSHDGPADGTSLMDQAARNAVGPGRIIVASAGNKGSFPTPASFK